MSSLFASTEINGMKLANRFVRSATWEGMAVENGGCTSRLVRLMTRLAEGGVGLIITGHAYVQSEGQSHPGQLAIHKDGLIEDLKEMTRAIHEWGSRVALQVSHGGLLASQELTGQPPLGPSQIGGFVNSPVKEMSVAEIRRVVQAFGRAAIRAKAAGFDAVQIHSAHGVLLSEFLSPAFNKRKDSYGGSIENRARFLSEVLRYMRSAVGDDYPLLVKMNSQDFLKEGLSLEDALQVGELLQECGVDAIELSGGTRFSGELSHWREGITSEEKEAYFREAAEAFKRRLHVPLVLVGGIRSFRVAERLISEGFADYVSMSRPFIREPHLVRRWVSGDLRRAKCVSDNKCYGTAMSGEGLYCMVEKRERELH
ncbi:MAG: NADH:flavin oxidoreductase [Pseudomonadota bacterium]